ncbi:MAG: hypothetical protein ACREBF_00015 [Candidatus Micrarchaeales archaeon]
MKTWQIKELELDASAVGRACADVSADVHVRWNASADAAAQKGGKRTSKRNELSVKIY